MPANFNPSFEGYTGVGAFRFWCQKVLPLVYDDSLSYYELLCKVVDYLNKTIADVATVETNLDALHTAYGQLEGYVNERVTEQRQYIVSWTEQMQEQFNTLQNFVNNYFDNLDVQEEINAKLDEMAAGGQLSALIAPLVAEEAPAIITDWLDENVDPSTTPIVDSSLTISGAAADAATVGEKFSVSLVNYGMLSSGSLNDIDAVNGVWTLTGSNSYTDLPTLIDPTGEGIGTVGTIIQVKYPGNLPSRVQILSIDGYGVFSRMRYGATWHSWKGGIDDSLSVSGAGADAVEVGSRTRLTYKSYTNGVSADTLLDNGVYFASKSEDIVSIQDLPYGNDCAGWLEVTRAEKNSQLVLQVFYPLSSTNVGPKFRVRRLAGSWDEWKYMYNQDLITSRTRLTYSTVTTGTSVNSIVDNGVYFNSVSGDVSEITDLPSPYTLTPGFLEVTRATRNGNIVLQTYYPTSNDTNKTPIYRTRRLSGEWRAWQSLGSGGNIGPTYEITQNYYTVEELNPDVSSSTPYLLTSTGDATDRTADIASMLATFGACQLGTGEFYVTNLTVPANCSLRGSGIGDSKIVMTSGATGDAVTLSTRSSISDVMITGGDTVSATNGGRHAIGWTGTAIYGSDEGTYPERGQISNIFIENMSGAGIHCESTSGKIYSGLNVVNVNIHECWAGIYIPYYSEYSRFTNCEIDGCEYGVLNNGGNNFFVNCGLNRNTIGFAMDDSTGQSPNNSHGAVIGCTFNHCKGPRPQNASNAGTAIMTNGIDHGFIFEGCNIGSKVELINSAGVVISSCKIAGTTITLDDGGCYLFANNIFSGTPTITVSNNPIIRSVNNYDFDGDTITITG